MISVNAFTPPRKPSVLVIDDEPDLQTLYELSLVREGYEVQVAGSVALGCKALAERSFDVVVSDMQLPDGRGLDILQFLMHQQRNERCVVITAYGSAENAVEALKLGAFDYLAKPVDLKQFRQVISQALRLNAGLADFSHSNKIGLADPKLSQSTIQKTNPALAAMVGQSQVMQLLRDRVHKVARTMAPVLIRGESGTGKELVARAIHACSHRCEGPFIAVNCGAIPENLIEAEFFGARKGAYTGAASDREGFFQAATGGTLFLDEIGDLPLVMQAKLLRAIQERVIRPIGDTHEIQINARILSATHRDLAAAVEAGQFRQDLYYRINVIEIAVPALRERMQDMPELVTHLLEKISFSSGHAAPAVSSDFFEYLQSMPLPGNIRELENVLHRAIALSDGALLDEAMIKNCSLDAVLPNTEQAGSSRWGMTGLPHDLQAHLDEQEKNILIQALRINKFNRTAAADQLGISLRQIRYRMARLGIDIHNIED